MATFDYKGIKVVQQSGAPEFFMTSAAAKELLAWCDVPRAKGDYMAGYQRLLKSSRVKDLAKYLQISPHNIVPAAVIVAVDEDYIQVDPLGDDLFRLSIREDTRDFETKLMELWGQFTTRLSEEELESAEIYHSGSENDHKVPTDGGAADILAALGYAESEDLSQSSDLEEPDDEPLDDLEDEVAYPSSYLAKLAAELSMAVEDWDSVSSKRQEAIRSYIDGVSKPGLIIDGQHRVFGANGVSEQDIQLPVVLLPGLDFSEQVFQFYVLNSTARPLKPTELRRIVSTSLTNAEIDELYHRFKSAGIEAEEARWTLELNERPYSPFQGRIDFGYEETGAIVPENVADQVVRGFMLMPRSRYQRLIDPLGELWTNSEMRLKIFFWFWNAIKHEYSEVWSSAEARADDGIQAQIFKKVSLLTLQRFILDRFLTALPYRAEENPPLSSEEEVKSMVSSTLKNLPQEFFSKEWKLKQMDTTEGRKEIYRAMELVWNNQGKIHGNMTLYKG